MGHARSTRDARIAPKRRPHGLRYGPRPVAERVRVSLHAAVKPTPTNKLDFQGSPDLDRQPRSPTRIAPMRAPKTSLSPHNPMPTRVIPIQAMKRSQGE